MIDVPGCVNTEASTVPSEYVATLFAGVAAGISMQPIQRICGSSLRGIDTEDLDALAPAVIDDIKVVLRVADGAQTQDLAC